MRNAFIVFLLFISFRTNSQTLYFPPVLGNTWETTSPSSLGWCSDRIDSLYNFLQQKNSKAFIVLKDGKIVLERYFGTFSQDSLWYWASAGKTITAYLVGKAKEQNFLSLSDSTSKYLGTGWTSCTPEQEGKITIRNQITMTSGLDDGTGDVYCTLPSCLVYKAPAGTRWAYHNAPYTLLEEVLVNATSQNINVYTQSVLKSQTGMNGLWITVDYNNVYYSNARSMARYGLLMQNKFKWNSNALLTDSVYIHDMVNTSQDINYSYGYLTWLNGSGSFMTPQLQLKFPGSYAPAAPADMYAALGKNGQIVSVTPSKGIVMIRMGNEPDAGDVPFTLCDSIWQKLNYVMCNSTPPKTYTFVGNGNWTNPLNWSNQQIPPAVLPAGDQIIIYPLGNNGECILNTTQTISIGAKLHIVADKKMTVNGNLVTF